MGWESGSKPEVKDLLYRWGHNRAPRGLPRGCFPVRFVVSGGAQKREDGKWGRVSAACIKRRTRYGFGILFFGGSVHSSLEGSSRCKGISRRALEYRNSHGEMEEYLSQWGLERGRRNLPAVHMRVFATEF
eukprot:922244-Amorphochlora_amoeboformis.AAC.1